MTTYSKRRGRRGFAAVLAAMLLASLLAVVAGSPAQAATTAFEVKHDHDNNAKTDDLRHFAGTDRYHTASLLAKNWAAANGGRGSVPAVFIASGDTLVDSISVAGLAGYTNAPVLLTPSGMLHGRVSNFIEDYGVDTVYVLGGAAAISDEAVTELEGLVNEPDVMRISGADRYATAAAIAAKIETASTWCGTSEKSAVLINGATDMLGYGVAAQTVAYKLQLPVLMTAPDELSEATADYLRDKDIEHVQIIGGTDVVSADVAVAVGAIGVGAVERVDGASAAEVSVMLAKLANNGCGGDLAPVSTDRVALVRANPDGVSAAPVLASSFVPGSLVTPLIVGDNLPASVRDYLAATPKTVAGKKLNLGIVAVGGTAAVSEATMKAALEAAASAGNLSVTIANAIDSNDDGVENADDPLRPDTTTAINRTSDPVTGPKFALYFSDDVTVDLGKIQDVVEVNGAPAEVLAAVANQGATCSARRVDVTLGQRLNAGDVVSVVGSKLKIGSGSDQRSVASTSATATAAKADTTRPTVTVLGIAGERDGVTNHDEDGFRVVFSDAGGLANIATAGEGALTPNSFSLVGASGKPSAAIEGVTYTAIDDSTTDVARKQLMVTVAISRTPDELEVGDRLTVKPGIVRDQAGNVNAGTSVTAIRAQASPIVSSVLMSNLKHSAHNMWNVPSSIVGGSTGNAAVRITAKGDGAAAGAAGNDWRMIFDHANTYTAPDTKPLDIDVRVDTKGKRVTVRFNAGPATATLGDLVKALNDDAEFSALFSAGFSATCTEVATAGPNSTHASKTPLGLVLTAATRNTTDATNPGLGRTQFAIEVRFSAWVDTVNHDELLQDVLKAAALRAKVRNGDTGIRAAADGSATASASGGLSLLAATEGALGSAVGPIQMVRYQGETALVKNLPKARDLVDVAAGIAAAAQIDGPPIVPAIIAVTPVATGYAADKLVTGQTVADDARDKTDEDKNGASQRRISVSSSVKAR